MKPHLYSELVNDLNAVAKSYVDTQQLRAQLARTLEKHGIKPAHTANIQPVITVEPLQWSELMDAGPMSSNYHIYAETPIGMAVIEWRGGNFEGFYAVTIKRRRIGITETMAEGRELVGEHVHTMIMSRAYMQKEQANEAG